MLGLTCVTCFFSQFQAQEIKNTIGHVSILINNAGIVFGKNIIDSNDEEIVKALDVNTLSHFWVGELTIII